MMTTKARSTNTVATAAALIPAVDTLCVAEALFSGRMVLRGGSVRDNENKNIERILTNN